jgi:ubiquinone/menaquinone biosynthesis C-methylase UbiE
MSLTAPPFEPRRFRTAAPYYARYRLGYPDALIARVASLVGLARGDAVMDLGCGPGLLAIPFAEAGMAVTAIDPEPDMLAEARLAANDANVAVDFRRASSFDLPADIGPFKLVTMGRSFHWMDRAHTLLLLDRLTLSDGALALFEDDHPRTVENAWLTILNDVGKRYGADQSDHRLATRRSDYRSHISYLLDSVFSEIERVGVVIRHRITTDDIVGRAYSLSVLSPEALGERAAAFETELRDELAKLSPDGTFTEIAELGALVARRG